jgi:hypothetical protein
VRYPEPQPHLQANGFGNGSNDFPGLSPWTSIEFMGMMCDFDPDSLPLSEDGMLSPLSVEESSGIALPHNEAQRYGAEPGMFPPSPNVVSPPAAAAIVSASGIRPRTPSVSATSSGGARRVRLRTPADTLHRPEVDAATRNAMLEAIRSAYPQDLLATFALPNRETLRRLIATYFTAFHQHLPIIHSPTFDLATTPPPLALAVLSIGALYSLERKKARMLRDWAKKLADHVCPCTPIAFWCLR